MPKATVYRCVTFKCCDGAPIKPSKIMSRLFMSNSEFDLQPHEWNLPIQMCRSMSQLCTSDCKPWSISIKPTASTKLAPHSGGLVVCRMSVSGGPEPSHFTLLNGPIRPIFNSDADKKIHRPCRATVNVKSQVYPSCPSL